jgi:hypothetical protein
MRWSLAAFRSWMKKPASRWGWASSCGSPGVAMGRNQFSAWFIVDQGKMRAVYSSMFYPDQDALAPNWPPYDGNWPVPPAPK